MPWRNLWKLSIHSISQGDSVVDNDDEGEIDFDTNDIEENLNENDSNKNDSNENDLNDEIESENNEKDGETV